jgi:hypothetical protein
MPLRRRGKSHECFILKNSESFHKRILADIGCDRSKVIVEKGTKVDNLPSLGIGCDTTALSLFIGECVEPCTQPGSGS